MPDIPVPKKSLKEKIDRLVERHGKLIIIILLVAAIGGLSSCGRVGQLKEDNESLRTQLEKTQKAYDKLQAEYDELLNGKDRILADANLAFEQQNWEEDIELADQLHKDYYNTDQDRQGQDLKKKAQKKKEEEEARKKAEEEAKG